MLITIEEHQRLLKSSFFRDCAIRNKDIFIFVRERSYTDEEVEEEERGGFDPSLRPKGIIAYFRGVPEFQPGNQWFVSPLAGWETIILGAAAKPLNQSISIESTTVFPSMESRVYVTGSGEAHEDLPLTSLAAAKHGHTNRAVFRGSVTRLKQIEGWLYGSGGSRTLFKRHGEGAWESFTHHIPRLPESIGKGSSKEGFEDFDGWSEHDIYAVGGDGDVWHFNGTDWRQIPFPSNAPLQSVCCGADGKVYISGYEGVTFSGRGNSWKKIYDGGISLGFRDMVWYEDRVWCTSDYGLWTIQDERVRSADVPPEVAACAGHLSVGDGVLLLAGLYGAVFREHGQWHTIVIFSAMDKLLALAEQEKKGEDL